MPSGGIRAVMGVVAALILCSCRCARPETENGPLPDRLISASRSFPQTETCLRPVQPPFPAATCRGARRRSCSCAQFFLPGRTSALFPENLPIPDVFPARGAVFGKKVLFLHCFHEALSREILGVPGFDSRQSLIVSTPSAVWRLVNPDARFTNGNNSYALAA